MEIILLNTTIAALISFCNLENEKQLFHFINEGLELSIENNITYFEYYFNGLKLESQSLILQNELQKNLLIQKISENNNSSNKIKEYECWQKLLSFNNCSLFN